MAHLRMKPVVIQVEKIADLIKCGNYDRLPFWVKNRYTIDQVIFQDQFIIFNRIIAPESYYIIRHPRGWTQIISPEALKNDYEDL